MRSLGIVVTSLLLAACQKSESPVDATDEATPQPGSSAGPLAGWVDYTGPESSYTAKFPARPKERTETVPVEGGAPQIARIALYESPGGTAAFFSMMYDVDMPGARFDPHDAVKSGIEGLLAPRGFTQDSTRDLTLGAAVGREVTFHGTSEGTAYQGVARLYAYAGDKPRVIQAFALGPRLTDEMRRFVDSVAPNIPAEAARAAEWVEHDGGAYKAKFPTKPEVQDAPTQTVFGERTTRLAMSSLGVSAFIVSSVDFQVPDGARFESAETIQRAGATVVKQFASDAQPVDERAITLKGLDGKELRFLVAAKLVPPGSEVEEVVRLLVDERGGKRLFTLTVMGRKPLDEKAVARFFDSFEPKDPGAAAAVDAGAGAGAGNLGPTCTKFVDTYTTCIDKMPEAARGPAKDGLKQMRDAWSKVPDAAMIESACKQAWDAAKRTMGAACPDVTWE